MGDSAAAWIMCCGTKKGKTVPVAASGLDAKVGSSMTELRELELAVAMRGDAEVMLDKLPFFDFCWTVVEFLFICFQNSWTGDHVFAGRTRLARSRDIILLSHLQQ